MAPHGRFKSLWLSDPEPLKSGTLLAVVDIGSSAIRLLIAEVVSRGEWRQLEVAEKPAALGRDVFETGRIGRETIINCIRILNGYRELMDAYDVKVVRAVGTSALREARNRDTFVDRVEVRTGLRVEVIEGIEANYLTYIAVQHALRTAKPSVNRSNSMIMEVGGGSTELMLMQRGKMLAAHTLRVGTVRIQQMLGGGLGGGEELETYLRRDIRSALEIFESEVQLARMKNFIAVGGDARLAARAVGRRIDEHRWEISRAAFGRFIEGLKGRSVDEVVQLLQVTYSEAEPLLPALLVYQTFLDATSATRVVVPSTSIRDGILLSVSRGGSRQFRQELCRQITASARTLGRKYFIDEEHADQVTDIALRLFDALEDEHRLNSYHRLLLNVAGLLHDVGTYVNPSSHHKHGEYLVTNSDLFGLSQREVAIIAQVVRYHRRALPLPTHANFMALPPEDRMLVRKLAALLRVADALDRGHVNRIVDFDLEVDEDRLVIRCPQIGDLSVERLSMARKADLFEEVFGLQVVLRQSPLPAGAKLPADTNL